MTGESPPGEPAAALGDCAVTTEYDPRPSETDLPDYLGPVADELAEYIHDCWARSRFDEGVTYGPDRDATHHPCLVPYSELSERERLYDRRSAAATLAFLSARGYRIVAPTCVPAEAPEYPQREGRSP